MVIILVWVIMYVYLLYCQVDYMYILYYDSIFEFVKSVYSIYVLVISVLPSAFCARFDKMFTKTEYSHGFSDQYQ